MAYRTRYVQQGDMWVPEKPKLRGFGDVVASLTKKLGISGCGGCSKRQDTLNRWIPFKDTTSRIANPVMNQRGMAGIPTRCSSSVSGMACTAPILFADDFEDPAFSLSLWGPWKSEGSMSDITDAGLAAHGSRLLRMRYLPKSFCVGGPDDGNVCGNDSECTAPGFCDEQAHGNFETEDWDSSALEGYMRWYERRNSAWSLQNPPGTNVNSIKVNFIQPLGAAGPDQLFSFIHDFGRNNPFQMDNQNGEDLDLNPNVGTISFGNDQWYCIEAHWKIQSSHTVADGEFDLWMNRLGEPERKIMEYTGQDFANEAGDIQGMGGILVSQQYNAPGPRVIMERYMDDIVASTQRIGCINEQPGRMPAGRLSTGVS